MNYKIGICAMLMLFLSACKNNQSDAEIEKAKAIVCIKITNSVSIASNVAIMTAASIAKNSLTIFAHFS